MSRVIVRGSSPGMVRIEVEGTNTFLDVDSGLPAYTALQLVAPFMQALLDATPPDHYPAEPKAATKSKAPPK